MPIRLLDPDVSSMIAAGEVVERPASVVKELVENSLDAGALEIVVEVRGDGTESVRVVDNGGGIPSDQVELAFERYATSKLTSAGDLDSIATLGFRGEALPSIASVSRLVLVTKTEGQEAGTRIELLDGEVTSVQAAGAQTGTAVTVGQLFRNFPARRRFLRTRATEVSRVQTIVTRYALAYPAVRFRLTVDDKEAFSSTGSGDLTETVSDVYGPKAASQMLDLIADDDTQHERVPTVSGLIGLPSLARANRSNISLFVNGRWVQSRMLGYALEQAYHGFMKERRYPTAVVHLAVPADEVDVNIHPTKAEVRFRHEGGVFSALQQSVRHTLTLHLPVPELTVPTDADRVTNLPPTRPFWPTELASPRPSEPAPSHATALHATGTEVALPGPTLATSPQPLTPSPLTPSRALPTLRVLGQVHTTYIVAEGPDGMYLVDQHAAHERVLFERVSSDADDSSADVQSLLEPVVVELDVRQNELVETQGELLEHIGFRVEPFGDRARLVRGVPGLLSESDPTRSLIEVLDLMAEGGGFESWQERAAYSVACHGAIRAGKTLTQQEMAGLMHQLEECGQPHTCPHGRPTMIHLSSGHLEREFGRR